MVLNCATAEDVLKAIKDEHVQMIDVRFTDLPGVWQHFSVPPSAVNEDATETRCAVWQHPPGCAQPGSLFDRLFALFTGSKPACRATQSTRRAQWLRYDSCWIKRGEKSAPFIRMRPYSMPSRKWPRMRQDR